MKKLFFRDQRVLKVKRQGSGLLPSQVLLKLRSVEPGAKPKWQPVKKAVFEAESQYLEVETVTT